MDFQVTNNIVEYEEIIFGIITSKKLWTNSIMLHSDSRSVINQYLSTFEAKDSKMRRYVERLKKECLKWDQVNTKKQK